MMIFLKISIQWKLYITPNIKQFCSIEKPSNTLKATVNVTHRIAGFDTINGYETAHNIVVGF